MTKPAKKLKKTRKSRKPKSENPYYVDKAEMLAELIKYDNNGIITEKLGLMFKKIATKFANARNFSSYTYKDDMIASALERMITQIGKFNVHHPSANPFGYFSLTAYNQFLAVLKKEKRQREIKQNYRQKIWDEMSMEEGLDPYVNDANNFKSE